MAGIVGVAMGAIPGSEAGFVTQRPAETVTAAAAAGLILARVPELNDPTVITALGAVIGLLPAAVTWLVETARRIGRLPPPSDVPAALATAFAEVGKAAADLPQDSRAISDRDKRGALITQVADPVKGMKAGDDATGARRLREASCRATCSSVIDRRPAACSPVRLQLLVHEGRSVRSAP